MTNAVDKKGGECDIPENYDRIYTSEQIAGRVKALGVEISNWARKVRVETGRDVVAVPVLRGGIFFFSDIVRALDTSVEILPVRTVAYDVGEIGVMNDEVKVVDDVASIRGRAVLLLDEICESGRTFEKLHETLRNSGATEVRSAVLVRRELGHETFEPTWVGFHLDSAAWCVGYGMDDRERWRNLSDIYVIRKD